MLRSVRRIAPLAIATTVVICGLQVPFAPAARAAGSTVHWVATSGTPSGTGTSCASPGYIGSTSQVIQSAMTAATAGDEIRICSGTYLINSTLEVDKALTFTASGVSMPIVDGQSTHRIMNIAESASTVSINGLQFQNGRVANNDEWGAAIKQHPNTNLSVSNSYFFRNVAVKHHGGGIALIGIEGGSNSGKLTVANSTFFKNSGFDGGGIVVVGVGNNVSSVSNSTFVKNHATRQGGAINGSFGDLRAFNSTFVNNTSGAGGETSWSTDITESLIAYSPNISPSADPCEHSSRTMTRNVSTQTSCLQDGGTSVSYSSLKLGVMAMWGGKTPTVLLGSASTAADAIPSADCPLVDQWGESRGSGNCAAGAVEPHVVAGSISPSSSVAILKNRAISSAPTFTTSGLTSPITYEIASDLSEPLPSGVSISPTTGVISGTPSATFSDEGFIVKATGNNNVVTFAMVAVDNCLSVPVNNKFYIGNATQLEEFRVAACGNNMNIVLTADIAWNGTWQGNYATGAGYTGTFDGAGHAITGLQISGGQNAFIQNTTGATVKDLTFDATVSGAYGSAGLVRLARTTTIIGVHGSGSVAHPIDEVDIGCIGGIAGEINDSTIRDSSYEGTINARNGSWNGGIIGCAYLDATIERVSFNGSVNGNSSIGGIAGYMELSEIRNSSAIGSVTGSGQFVGSIVGEYWFDNNYTGTVLIENTLSSMEIQGGSNVGSIIGYGPSTALSSTLWEVGLSGTDGLSPIGSIMDSGASQPPLTGTSLANLKKFSTFNSAGWSIVDGWEDSTASTKVWGICDASTRPFLLSLNKTNPCVQPQQPNPETPSSPATPSTPSTPSTPTTPSTPSTPSTPAASESVNVDNPKVQSGKTIVVIDGKEVSSSLTASRGTRMSGTVGGIRLVLDFGPSSVVTSSRVAMGAGAPISISLRGLRPGSRVATTLFSTPTQLGGFTVSADGTVNVSTKISSNISAGSHRLRLSMVNKDGQTVNVWIGITVATSLQTLPATGSSNAGLMMGSMWLLLLGGLFTVANRRQGKI